MSKEVQSKGRIDAKGLERAIHLWSANLDQVSEPGEPWEEILDEREQERAAAYRILLLKGRVIYWENEPEHRGERASWLVGKDFLAALVVKGEMKPFCFLDWHRDYRDFQKGTISDASGRYKPSHHWFLA